MSADAYDVVVVGGGIHGAGIAQAVAAAGHSVLVLEQSSLAAGTSSRSSKLIHGGLRYLETAQFSLVRECLRERAALLRLAPDLVHRVAFHLPVYRETARRSWQLRAGLTAYAVLAGMGHDARFRGLPRRLWDQLDGLETRGLRAVFRYWDAQTDDAALTRAVMSSAQRLGAELRMPARFTGAELDRDGSDIAYHAGSTEHSCRARVLVNAAGPWVERVLAAVRPAIAPLPVALIQGTHLILEGRLCQGIYYLESPRDRRGIFAMPWQTHLLLGTTEHPYQGDPGQVHPLEVERSYLLEALAHYFPAFRQPDRVQILDGFAGLRVLAEDADRPFRRARDVRLQTDRARDPRVLSVYGGKLTAFRATAQRVLARIAPALPARPPRANLDQLPLAP
ncbi:MAG: glycerol-3-phosphate dehydrogenase/oxidase [Gammaproteobacteria bacterium]